MILNKLRLLQTVYRRHETVQQTLRCGKISFPALTQTVRMYARFIDDDLDDMPPKSRDAGRSSRNSFDEQKSFGQRKSFGDRGSFGDRSSFGERKSFGDRKSFGERRPFGEQKPFNSRFNNDNRGAARFNQGMQTLTPVRYDVAELGEIKKEFYQPSEITKSRSDEEILEFRQRNEISVPNIAPKPIFSFNELENLPKEVAKEIQSKKFGECTPIQAQGMPIALSGKNMVGIAQTGSGKTLAYTVPAIIHILNQPLLNSGDGPIALVLAPTRELAQQIQKVAAEYGASSGIRNAVLYGGSAKAFQIQDLRKTPQLVVATPGRLIDLLSTTNLNLRRCSYLVLDEADRMLDMGFEPQMRQIVSQIRPDRQTLMWSATWPREVRTLARDFLGNDFMQLSVGSSELCANHNIKQVVRVCDEDEKYDVLLEIMEQIKKLERSQQKTLIFAQTKRLADELARQLNRRGLNSEAIHGNRSQAQREQILEAYRGNRLDILVATDVASRGLDVSDIKHVINFDYPNTTEDYVHRIGRTGRSKSNGTAYTLFTTENASQASNLIAVLQEANQEIDPALMEMSNYRPGRRGGKYRDFD